MTMQILSVLTQNREMKKGIRRPRVEEKGAVIT
jgi:hypothetical protein